SRTVSVIDGVTNNVTATIDAGDTPDAVGVDPSTHTVYVANSYSGVVSVIDETTNTVTATVQAGQIPVAVGVDPSTHTIYVANSYNHTLTVIDGNTTTVIATVQLPGGLMAGPTAVGLDLSAHRLYIPNNSNNTVAVIDMPQPGPNSVSLKAGNTTAGVSWQPPGYLLNGLTVNGY